MIQEYTSQEVQGLKEYVLIDIRLAEQYDENHIEGSYNVPADNENMEAFVRQIQDITDTGERVLYCNHGHSSFYAAQALESKGIRTASLKGGYLDWIKHIQLED